MSTLDYFDQATLAILHGQGCSPEQALRLARDLVDRRGKFVEGLGCRTKNPTPLAEYKEPEVMLFGAAGEGEG